MPQFKRFNASENDNYASDAYPNGTLTWDPNNGLRLHDGSTSSGNPVIVGNTIATGSSSVSLTENGVNITTDIDVTPGGKSFEFRDTGILVLPSGGDIQDSSSVSVIDKEPKFTLKYQNFNASAGTRYCIDAVGQAVTATLPASPSIGDAIYFVDAYGSFNTNNLTIVGNGKTIMGSSTLVVSTANQSVGVFYSGAEWRTY